MKVGILGGSFNPVHNAHLAVAEDVRVALFLDQIWFLCAGQPPHKSDVLPAEHRFRMLQMALKDHPCFLPSDIEIREGFQYSVETLTFLTGRYPQHEFYFLVGYDAFQEMNTWKDWRKLFGLCNFVIFNRAGRGEDVSVLLLRFLGPEVKPAPDNKVYEYRGKKIYNLKVADINISGSGIRQMIRDGRDIRPFMNREAAEYIATNNLYK